jgi:hypothetical protein
LLSRLAAMSYFVCTFNLHKGAEGNQVEINSKEKKQKGEVSFTKKLKDGEVLE